MSLPFLLEVQMTIEQAKYKVIALARQEIGYHEGANNSVKYNTDDWDDRLYGWNTECQPWCDIFVDWLFIKCFGYDRGSAMTYQYSGCCGASCPASASYYQSNGAFFNSPEVGDQIFFYSSDGGIGHTGIVESVSGNQITTIEGNYSDSVCRNHFQVGDSKIAGYGRPNWKLVANGTEDTEESEETSATDEEEYVAPEPDEAYDSTTITVQPIVVAEYHEEGVHVCRPSEASYYVWAMQYLLKENGYDVQADGYYANGTAKYVIQFQRDRDLEVDALCGEKTWAELYKDITLMITNQGYAVRAMQYLLKAHDYFIYTDEVFGSQTHQQLVRFQKSKGIEPASGICAESTWNELVKGS